MSNQIYIKSPGLKPENIKKDVKILNVTGTYEGGSQVNIQPNKTVTPSQSQQTVTPDSGYDALERVTVNATQPSWNCNPITFYAHGSDLTITLAKEGNPSDITMYYDINYADSWTAYTPGTSVTGSIIRFRGLNNGFSTDDSNYYHFVSGTNEPFSLSGSVMSLSCANVNGIISELQMLSHQYQFAHLFDNYPNNGLTNCAYVDPDMLKAMNTTVGCYKAMFRNLTYINSPVVIPTVSLSNYCFESMFEGTGVYTANLPGLNVGSYTGCYNRMFYNCANIRQVKVDATSWNSSNATDWLYGVNNDGVIIKKLSLNIPTSSTSGIPSGWIVTNNEVVIQSNKTVSAIPWRTQTVTPDSGYDTLESVTVEQLTVFPGGGNSSIGSDVQTFIPASGTYYSDFTIYPLTGQSKTVTPGASQIVVTPDVGYDCLTSVTVNAVSRGQNYTMDTFLTLPDGQTPRYLPRSEYEYYESLLNKYYDGTLSASEWEDLGRYWTIIDAQPGHAWNRIIEMREYMPEIDPETGMPI